MKRKLSVILVICLIIVSLLSGVPVYASASVSINLGSVVNSDFEGLGLDYEPFMWWPTNFAAGFTPDDWDTVSEYWKNMSPSWARIMYNQGYCEPANDNSDPWNTNMSGFSWESPEMLSLYKHMDLLNTTGTDAMVTTDWLYSESIWGWYTNTHSYSSTPQSTDEMTENIIAFLNYMKNTKGYSNIKAVGLFNELNGDPNFDSVLKDYTTALHNRMNSAGIRSQYRLTAPDCTDGSSRIQYVKDNYPSIVDMYDYHDYVADPNPEMDRANNIVQGTKKIWLTEFGDYPDSMGDGTAAGNKIGKWVIAGLNKNISMIAYWTSMALYRQYGLEQDVSLWWFKNKDGKWPAKKQYYAFQLLSKWLKRGSTVYNVTSDNNNVTAAAVKTNSDGKYTVVVQNTGASAESISINFSSAVNQTFYRYEYSSAVVSGRTDPAGLPSTASYSVGATISDTIPAGSFVVYTSISDTTAAAISKVSSTKQSDVSFNVAWHTDKSADSIIEYGTTTSYGSTAGNSSSYVGDHSVNITGLTAGTLYHYRIKSTDSRGNIGYSGDFTFESNDNTSPAQVANVTVMDNAGEAEQDVKTASRLTLKWSANLTDSDLDMYRIYMSTTSGFTPSASNQIGTSNQGRFVAGALNPNTTYYFKVTAVDKSRNESAASTEVSGTTLNTSGVSMTENSGEYIITAPDYRIVVNKFFGTARKLYDGDGYQRLNAREPFGQVVKVSDGTVLLGWDIESTVTYENTAPDHKRIVVTNSNGMRLDYDFYPDRIRLNLGGGFPDGYHVNCGDFNRMEAGGYSAVTWPDNTLDVLNAWPNDTVLSRTTNDAVLIQEQTKRNVEIKCPDNKLIKFTPQNIPVMSVFYNWPVWQAVVDVASGSYMDIYFPRKVSLDGLSNMARSAKVSVSSTIENYGWSTYKINDGNMSSSGLGWTSAAQASQTNTQSVTLDFECVKTVDRVILYPRRDTGNEGKYFPIDFNIQVSTDNITWTTVITQTNYTNPGYRPQTFTFTSTNARYVKINATKLSNAGSGNYHFQLAEIEIYNNSGPNNIAKNKTVVASSIENSSLPASYAVDGDYYTRWSSQFSDPQWIYVDLGTSYAVSRVVLAWETAYGKTYKIQYSSDASTWYDAYSTSNGDGGIDDVIFTPVTGRYIRMYGTERGTQYGYSLYEFEVYQ